MTASAASIQRKINATTTATYIFSLFQDKQKQRRYPHGERKYFCDLVTTEKITAEEDYYYDYERKRERRGEKRERNVNHMAAVQHKLLLKHKHKAASFSV